MAASSRGMVLLFEDDEVNGDRIANAIKGALSSQFSLLHFDDHTKRAPEITYEDDLYRELCAPKYRPLSLVVSDRDLSKSERYPGLSEAVVSKVAARLGVPVCVYAAGQEDSVLERQKSGGDGRIILDSSDHAAMAKKVSILATGFQFVRKKVASLTAPNRSPHGPGALVAKILGRPEVADHLSLYTTGDQRMIVELMPSSPSNDAVTDRRLPTALGSWFYDSVLRFPGLLVEEVSAASYLNIDVDTFGRKKDVRKVFVSALYRGPFADPSAPRWWRDRIDDLLQKAKAADGRALAQKRLNRRLKPCQCSVDPSLRAGFYCVVSRKPVSREKSQGNISWLPRGADLSRVSKELFAELEPWIGLR